MAEPAEEVVTHAEARWRVADRDGANGRLEVESSMVARLLGHPVSIRIRGAGEVLDSARR